MGCACSSSSSVAVAAGPVVLRTEPSPPSSVAFVSETGTCLACRNRFGSISGNGLGCRLSCGHTFHASCLADDKRCPACGDISSRPRAPAPNTLPNCMYKPKCPKCDATYSKPPHKWNCPMCLRVRGDHVKCWQPDDASSCGVCERSVCWFTRHHCWGCGRVVCGKCSDHKVQIPHSCDRAPLRACKQCVAQLAPHVHAEASLGYVV